MPIATTTVEKRLSDSQMIYQIRNTPAWLRIWEQLTTEQRRKALIDAEGDTWHLETVLEDAGEYEGGNHVL